MNWTAFWIALVVIPAACTMMAWAPLIIFRVVLWWDARPESFRQKVRMAGNAIGGVGAVAIVIAFAALVGYTWDEMP